MAVGENRLWKKRLRTGRRFDRLAFLGAWGVTPTENDAARDWLEQLFESSQLESRVLSTLGEDIHESADEVRATAYLAGLLLAADLWPSETKRQTEDLATYQLNRMLDERVFTNSLIVAEIRNEIRRFEAGSSR